MDLRPRCVAKKKNGQPCQAVALPGSQFCLYHDPDRSEYVRQARKKGGKARSKATFQPKLVLPPEAADVPLRSVEDIIHANEMAYNRTAKGELDCKVAAVLASIAGHQLKALQANDLQALATELQQLKARLAVEANHVDEGKIVEGDARTAISGGSTHGQSAHLGPTAAGPGTDYGNGRNGTRPLAGDSATQPLFENPGTLWQTDWEV
jgi:hypothetical protein